MSLVAPTRCFQLGSQFMNYLCYHLIDLTLWRCYHQVNICSSCPQGRLSPQATSFFLLLPPTDLHSWIHLHLPFPKFGFTPISQTNHELNSLLKRNYSLLVILKRQDRFYSVYCRRGKRPQYKPSSILLKQKVRSFSNAGMGSKKSPIPSHICLTEDAMLHCWPLGSLNLSSLAFWYPGAQVWILSM